MINQHFYIARLIARYLSDEIGEEEQAELTRWRNESPENERLFREICKEENIKQNMQKRQTFHTEDGWEGVQRKIQRHRFRHRILNIGSSSNLVVISFLFQLSSSFLILLKVVDMFAF